MRNYQVCVSATKGHGEKIKTLCVIVKDGHGIRTIITTIKLIYAWPRGGKIDTDAAERLTQTCVWS